MAKKGKREKIKLESSADTGHFYTTAKNKTNTPGKLEMKKYDPVVRSTSSTRKRSSSSSERARR